jgi:hypothetical protein
MKAEKLVLVTVGTTKFDSLIKATDEDKLRDLRPLDESISWAANLLLKNMLML